MKVTAGWITGFFFALSSSTLHAVAYQMFRRVHNNIAMQVDSESSAEEAANATRRTSYIWKPFWLLGFSCMVVGALSDILALGYAPAALVAPMIGSLTLICNMCLNPIISGEAVSRRTIGITLLICCSTVITILFSPRGDHNEGHDIGIELKDIYLSSNFALFRFVIVHHFIAYLLPSNTHRFLFNFQHDRGCSFVVTLENYHSISRHSHDIFSGGPSYQRDSRSTE